MRRNAFLAALAILTAPVCASAQTGLPPPFAAAVAETVARQKPMAYDVTVQNEHGIVHYTFNPTIAGDARVRVISPPESEIQPDLARNIQRLRRDGDGDIWCASRKLLKATNVHLMREDAESAVYTFTPSVEQVGEANAAIAPLLRGEATVSKDSPDVTAMRIYSMAPFHASIARIDHFSLSVKCDVSSNGRRIAVQTETELRGSALMQRLNNHSTSRISNLRPAA